MKNRTAASGLSTGPNDQSRFTILRSFPSPDIEKAWRDCLSRVEFPAHYDAPEYFAEPYWAGRRPFVILAMDQGAVVGVLTGLHEENEVVCGLQSRPQICIDPTADSSAVLNSLARGLLEESGSVKLVTVYTWSWMPLDMFEVYGFSRRVLEGNVVLDLSKSSEVLFKQFHENRRRNIRYAIRQGVDVFQAKTLKDASEFYDVYLRWRKMTRKKIRGEELPWTVFEQRFTHGENVRFFLARYSGKVIAGITLRFLRGGLIEFANNSSLDAFLHLRPNDLLQWRAIEWACSEGFCRYSLGGAHLFLRRFGGTVVPIHRYRLDRSSLRHYERREAALDIARVGFRKLPHSVQKTVRRFLGKPEPILPGDIS